jgi:ABC-type amino acid transport substrate-binding protein
MRPGVIAAALLAVVGLGCAGKPAHAAPLRMCLDKANPIFTVDQAVANAVAKNQNVAADLIVMDSVKDGDGRLSGKGLDKYLQTLAARCDVIMGFPVEAGHATLPTNMAATLPYVRTGFVAATIGAPAPSFSTMVAKQKTMGVVMLTVPSTYFTAQNMTDEHVYYSNAELLTALDDGEINAALIWQPWLVQQLAGHPQSLRVSHLAMAHAVWNIVGLYPEADKNSAAVRMFNHGVASLAASGGLAKIIKPYNAPTLNQ